MANLGMTKLQLVQHLTLLTGFGRVGALNTSGADDAADAEFIIDEVIDDLVHAGAHDSVKVLNYEITAAGDGSATVPDTTLRVFSTGKYQEKRFTLAGDKIYNSVQGKSVGLFAAGEIVVVDLHKRASNTSPSNYELLDPAMKAMVAKEAKVRFLALKRPDPARDAMLVRERNQTYATQASTTGELRSPQTTLTNPINIPPLVQPSRQQ